MLRELLLLTDPSRPKNIGDVLNIQAPGFVWGSAEYLDTFLVVQMDLTPEQEASLSARTIVPDPLTGLTTSINATTHLTNYIDTSGVDLTAIKNSDWLVPLLTADAIKAR